MKLSLQEFQGSLFHILPRILPRVRSGPYTLENPQPLQTSVPTKVLLAARMPLFLLIMKKDPQVPDAPQILSQPAQSPGPDSCTHD